MDTFPNLRLFYGKENEEYSPAVRGYESKDGLER